MSAVFLPWPELFARTLKFLEDGPRRAVAGVKARRGRTRGEAGGELEGGRDEGREEELAGIIAAQCAFKAKIVAGDEREELSRTDARSRRVLNFGHTVGHALEAVTGYRRFRHGEAVGHGMLVAAEISKRLGLLDVSELESLRGAVRAAGRLPAASDLDADKIIRALGADKKAVGGRVRWVLLERIGRARVVRESIRAALGARRKHAL